MTSRRAGRVTDADKEIGRRLRDARLLAGLSQEFVAEQLKLSFQQVQKYERGTNRITAARLVEAAAVLQQPVSFFFDAAVAPHVDDDAHMLRMIRAVRALTPEQRNIVVKIAALLGAPSR